MSIPLLGAGSALASGGAALPPAPPDPSGTDGALGMWFGLDAVGNNPPFYPDQLAAQDQVALAGYPYWQYAYAQVQ